MAFFLKLKYNTIYVLLYKWSGNIMVKYEVYPLYVYVIHYVKEYNVIHNENSFERFNSFIL